MVPGGREGLPDIVQIQTYTNYCPRGLGGTTAGETIFIRIFLNETSGQFQLNLVLTILAGREFKFIQMKGQVFFKRG
jgi:hypothetical protein